MSTQLNRVDVEATPDLRLYHRFRFQVKNARHCDALFKDFIKGREQRSKEARAKGEKGYTVRYIPDYSTNIIEISDDSLFNCQMLIRMFKNSGEIRKSLKWEDNKVIKKVLANRRD